MDRYEIKNNLYHGIGLIKSDGSQVNLGSRKEKDSRKVSLNEEEVNIEQLKNLADLNIISVKKIKGQG